MNTDDVSSLPAVSTYLLLEVDFFLVLGDPLLKCLPQRHFFSFRHTHEKTPWSTYVFLPSFLVIPPRRVFPWEKKQDPAGAGSITCEFTLTCEPKTHCT